MSYESNKLISVVVPCYNEEKTIPFFYEEITKIINDMKEVDFEIVFIDDGSSDTTLSIIKELHENNEFCRYLSFSRNFGKEAALYAGLEAAKGDFVVIMDVDLQDPPSYIPNMYEILSDSEYDCVATMRADRKGEKVIRSFFSELFYKIMNKMTQIEVKQGSRDFRMMTRQMVNAIMSMSERNRFSKGLFMWVGFKTKWLDYKNVERVDGETKWSFLKLVKYGLEGIMAFSMVPLAVVSWIGLFFCFVAFLVVLLLVIKNLIWHDPVPGWASMTCIIVFLGGIQMLCMGVIGRYIASMYTEIKQRPIYVLKESSDDIIG